MYHIDMSTERLRRRGSWRLSWQHFCFRGKRMAVSVRKEFTVDVQSVAGSADWSIVL